MTTTFESLSHSKWECKYHIVFIPKYRKKALYGKIREFLKKTFHELARQHECEIIGGNIVQDHVHMIISIPPKHAISKVVGYLKGKSAIAIARQFSGVKRNFNGEKFWARGYCVSTIGYELDKIRAYVKNQEQLDSKGFDEDGNF
jgi:putative transposase